MGQVSAVLALHDQGLDTDAVVAQTKLPWMIVASILRENNRPLRPRELNRSKRK